MMLTTLVMRFLGKIWNNAHHPCDAIPQQDLVNKWKGSDSVDAAGKVAQAVAVANEAAGLEGAGTLAAQVRKHS